MLMIYVVLVYKCVFKLFCAQPVARGRCQFVPCQKNLKKKTHNTFLSNVEHCRRTSKFTKCQKKMMKNEGDLLFCRSCRATESVMDPHCRSDGVSMHTRRNARNPKLCPVSVVPREFLLTDTKVSPVSQVYLTSAAVFTLRLLCSLPYVCHTWVVFFFCPDAAKVLSTSVRPGLPVWTLLRWWCSFRRRW